MAKLLIQGIPNFLPSEELLLLPGSFTIEAEPSPNSQAEFYHASAVFQNPEEAWQAFQEFQGEEVSIYGWSEKKILFRSHSGKNFRLKIVNTLPRPAGLPPSVIARYSPSVEAALGPGVRTRKRKAEWLLENPTAVTAAAEELDARHRTNKLLRELYDEPAVTARSSPAVTGGFMRNKRIKAAAKKIDGEQRAKWLPKKKVDNEAFEADVALLATARKRTRERLLKARQNEPELAKKFRSILEKHAAMNNSRNSIKK